MSNIQEYINEMLCQPPEAVSGLRDVIRYELCNDIRRGIRASFDTVKKLESHADQIVKKLAKNSINNFLPGQSTKTIERKIFDIAKRAAPTKEAIEADQALAWAVFDMCRQIAIMDSPNLLTLAAIISICKAQLNKPQDTEEVLASLTAAEQEGLTTRVLNTGRTIDNNFKLYRNKTSLTIQFTEKDKETIPLSALAKLKIS